MTPINHPVIQHQLSQLENSFANDASLPIAFYDDLQSHPEHGLEVMRYIREVEQAEQTNDEETPLIMACLHYIEMCLVQLKLSEEHHQKSASMLIDKYQTTLLELMTTYPESNYWLPIINLFFEANIDLNDDIKDAYLQIMEQHQRSQDSIDHQQELVEQLLADDSEASDYEIADLFLAQTNALPNDYFPSFLKELLSFKFKKAINAAVLFCLHPNIEIRDTIIYAANDIFGDITLPPESMSRLLMIRHWLPNVEKGHIESLINEQRRKGATFADLKCAEIIKVVATEMDGTGAQALFFILKRKAGYQAAGLLVKRYMGIKDAWLSPVLSKKEAEQYASHSMDNDFYLRKVDKAYLELIIADHIYQSQKVDSVPHLSLLQLQEITDSQWQARPLDVDETLANLKASIGDIDQAFIEKSLQRSGNFYKKYGFTQSWFDESPELDKFVNLHSSFIDGIKHCDMSKALPDIMENYFEPHREQWLEHFLWLALWAKPNARHNEYLWKDAYVIASILSKDTPMIDIPLLQVICEHSIMQSLETMESRKTHLS